MRRRSVKGLGSSVEFHAFSARTLLDSARDVLDNAPPTLDNRLRAVRFVAYAVSDVEGMRQDDPRAAAALFAEAGQLGKAADIAVKLAAKRYCLGRRASRR